MANPGLSSEATAPPSAPVPPSHGPAEVLIDHADKVFDDDGVKTISVNICPAHMAKKMEIRAVPLTISAAIGAVIDGYAKQLVGL